MTATTTQSPATRTRPSERGPRAGKLRLAALRWAVLAAFGVVWQLAASAASSPYFPPLVDILGRARDNWFSGEASTLFLSAALSEDVVPSLVRLLVGWALAVVVGVLLGLAIGTVRGLAAYLDPSIHFVRAIPPPVLIPAFIVLLGIGDQMKVVLIAVGVVWPILLNTIDGVRSVDDTQRQTGRIYGIRRSRQLTHIVLPAAAPKIFAGLRVSLSLALILMVISEMYAATDGIGFFVVTAQRSFRLLDMWAGIFLLGVLGYLLNAILLAVEQRTLAWHRGARGSDR